VRLGNFIFVFFFSGALGGIFCQPLEDPFYETGLADRISGYAHPANSWDLTIWPNSLAESILNLRNDFRVDSIDKVYINVLDGFRAEYSRHGLSIDPKVDGGRFDALQRAINVQVVDHNVRMDQYESYWSYTGMGFGLVLGLGAGILAIKKSLSKGRFFTRANMKKAGGLGLVGVGCGAVLGLLVGKMIHKDLTPFTPDNSALKASWNELESLKPRSRD